jgi:hypothetical protein
MAFLGRSKKFEGKNAQLIKKPPLSHASGPIDQEALRVGDSTDTKKRRYVLNRPFSGLKTRHKRARTKITLFSMSPGALKVLSII